MKYYATELQKRKKFKVSGFIYKFVPKRIVKGGTP